MISAELTEPLELVTEVERGLEELEALGDAQVQEKATRVVQALFELYGAGLERIVEVIATRADSSELARELVDDELISHLLLLHGLHPVAVEDRVLEALDSVRPYLESHGGNVELLGIEGAAVHLRLHGSCSGCPSSAMTLKLAIENAIHKVAPEIETVVADEPAPTAPAAAPGLLQIEIAPAPAPAPAPVDGSWAMAGGLPMLTSAAPLVKEVEGKSLLFLKLSGRTYAYQARCPTCQASLEGAPLAGTELTCRGCGDRYDVLRAGRGLDRPDHHLEPVPLLEGDDGLVKVALAVVT
jgi:Fe-S cluster biogenesis protein NfuA/nitrite reductase/ring-hydroxylating ferredoxin subunit